MNRLTKGFVLLIAALCLGVWALPAQADALADQQKAQGKLLAYRAARMDAVRKLAERIKGLHITSETTVKDFVTESDTIEAALNTFLRGMREVGKPKYMDDGTCELKMEVTLEEISTTLKEIHNRYAKGDKFKAEDFVQMTQTNTTKVLTETGSGAPRPPADTSDDLAPVPEGTSYDSGDMVGPRAKAYWKANVMPQGRLGAIRAARVDAMRKLVERIAGTQINSETIVRDFVTEKDEINALASAMLRGAREVRVRYHDDEPVVEVEVAVTLETVWETVKTWSDRHYKGEKYKIKEFQERIQKTDRKVLTETGMGVVRADLLKGTPPAGLAVAEAAMKWPPSISETGSAAIDTENTNKAQAKLMAFRAAELDARRKLAERLDGLLIDSETSVKDFVTEHDDIRTAMMTFQQSGYVVDGSQKVKDDGTVEVTVAIEPAPLWNIVAKYRVKVVKKAPPVEVDPE